MRSKASSAKQFGLAVEFVELFGHKVPVKSPTPREFIMFEELARDQVTTPTEQNIKFAATLITSRCGVEVDPDDLMNTDYTDDDETAIARLMDSFFNRLRIRAKAQLEQVKQAQEMVRELRPPTGPDSTVN